MRRSVSLILFSKNMVSLLLLLLATGMAFSQSAKKKVTSVVINVDVCITPSPPTSPVPIPYPNVVKSVSTTSSSKYLVNGQSLTFILSGENLEHIDALQVYVGGSKSNLFEAKLEPVYRKKNVRQRRVMLTPKGKMRNAEKYRLNFKKDPTTRSFFSDEFTVRGN
jgi:hypothetical protein